MMCALEQTLEVHMADPEPDPHVAWEVEWLTAWAEYDRLADSQDLEAQQAASHRWELIKAKILGTPVSTPQGAAVQLRIATEEQLDLHRWLPNLPAQLERMAAA